MHRYEKLFAWIYLNILHLKFNYTENLHTYEMVEGIEEEKQMADADRLTKLQEILKKGKRTPVEVFTTVLRFLDFKEAEIRIYKLLLKKEMGVSEIVQNLNASERSARAHIKTLYEKGFVKRRVVIGNRLKYAYSSVSPEIAWQIVRGGVNKTLNRVDTILKNANVFF